MNSYKISLFCLWLSKDKNWDTAEKRFVTPWQKGTFIYCSLQPHTVTLHSLKPDLLSLAKWVTGNDLPDLFEALSRNWAQNLIWNSFKKSLNYLCKIILQTMLDILWVFDKLYNFTLISDKVSVLATLSKVLFTHKQLFFNKKVK